MDKFIADAVYLFTKSSPHCKWRLDHAYQLIVHPAKAGRAKIVYRNGRPRCFYSYMQMSPEVEESYLKHNRMFQPEDWSSNHGSLWMIDFIAPFGDAYSIARELYKELAVEFPDHDIAYSRRRSKGGHRRSFKRLKHA